MSALGRLGGRVAVLWRNRPRTVYMTGAIFLLVAALGVTVLYYKPSIMTALRSGDTITAEFPSNYHARLWPNETKVKVAGLIEGVVSSIDYTPQGRARVSMKVDQAGLDALGSAPSASVEPITVLGGQYSIDLKRGGHPGTFTGKFIPVQRTHLPVELGQIVEALPGHTRKSLQHVVGELDGTLTNGQSTVRQLVADAPHTLRPAGAVLNGLRGTDSDSDLSGLVSNLDSTAAQLSHRQGQLDGIVHNLGKTADVLAARAQPLAQGIADLPPALRNAKAAMGDLSGTLNRLNDTSVAFRPAAREVDPLLQRLGPVLDEAQPLLGDLHPALNDLQPTVNELVPTVRRGTATLQPLHGPVLDRVNGPVTHMVMNTWRGSGPYKNSGGGTQANHKFYEELGYLAANIDRASKTQDAQGNALGFQVGANIETPQGLPFTLQNLLAQLQKIVGGGRK